MRRLMLLSLIVTACVAPPPEPVQTPVPRVVRAPRPGERAIIVPDTVAVARADTSRDTAVVAAVRSDTVARRDAAARTDRQRSRANADTLRVAANATPPARAEVRREAPPARDTAASPPRDTTVRARPDTTAGPAPRDTVTRISPRDTARTARRDTAQALAGRSRRAPADTAVRTRSDSARQPARTPAPDRQPAPPSRVAEALPVTPPARTESTPPRTPPRTPPPAAAPVDDGRTPLQRLADSTSRNVALSAEAADTAAIQSQYAVSDSLLGRARSVIATARLAARNARDQAQMAIVQGDRVGTTIESGLFEPAQAQQFAQYWKLGRAKLDSARLRSATAAQLADSALGCPTTRCATQVAKRMYDLLRAAAGASREAESYVRVALTPVR